MPRYVYIVYIGNFGYNFKIFGAEDKAFAFLTECYYAAFTDQTMELDIGTNYESKIVPVDIAKICSKTISNYNGNYKKFLKDLRKSFRENKLDVFGNKDEIYMHKVKINWLGGFYE